MGRFSSHDHAPETHANPVLAPAMDQVRSFEAKAEGMRLERFDAFREALEGVMRLLK